MLATTLLPAALVSDAHIFQIIPGFPLPLGWRLILWENTMNMKSVSGAAMAAAAAGLFLSGAVMAPTAASAKAAAIGHCLGGNACKGQSACKSGDHACKGQNACKGQGFSELSKSQCGKIGGKYEKA